MPVIDPLTISPPLSEKPAVVVPSQPIDGGLLESLRVRPSSGPYRNGLFLVLLTAAVAAFWYPLNELYALSQQQEHYSHIVLIPWLSLYALYVDRDAILSAGRWSPWMGVCVMAAGMITAWQAEAVASGPDVLSAQVLGFVVVCWGMFVLCYGPSAARMFSFGLLFLLCAVPLPVASQ